MSAIWAKSLILKFYNRQVKAFNIHIIIRTHLVSWILKMHALCVSEIITLLSSSTVIVCTKYAHVYTRSILVVCIQVYMFTLDLNLITLTFRHLKLIGESDMKTKWQTYSLNVWGEWIWRQREQLVIHCNMSCLKNCSFSLLYIYIMVHCI